MKDNKYHIIWKHFEPDSPIGHHLKALEVFSLPYFIDGEAKEKFEKKLPVSLNPTHLIKGLLVGYFDQPPGIDTGFATKKAEKILREQQAAIAAESLEQLILQVSNLLREKHGSQTSLQALMTGTELLPESHNIKYDCCIDLIQCIDDDLIEDRLAGIQKLRILLSEIKKDQLHPDLVQDYLKMIDISKEL